MAGLGLIFRLTVPAPRITTGVPVADAMRIVTWTSATDAACTIATGEPAAIRSDPRVIKAAIPGVIEKIETRVGAKVSEGETLMILEAMKMLNRIKAPFDGKIKVIRVASGEKVTKGQVLIEIE